MDARVVVEARVDATPELVFPAFTSADELARWWWPHLPDTTYAIDPRPGGAYAIRSQAAGIGVEGDVLRLDPPRRLDLTWRWLNDGVPEPEEPVIREGWESVLGRLRERFAGA
jgi:uncharacterized protein YndB with AHSA1/START domain